MDDFCSIDERENFKKCWLPFLVLRKCWHFFYSLVVGEQGQNFWQVRRTCILHKEKSLYSILCRLTVSLTGLSEATTRIDSQDPMSLQEVREPTYYFIKELYRCRRKS